VIELKTLIISTVSGRLRQIDGRIRFLSKRIEAAEVVDPEARRAGMQRRRNSWARPFALLKSPPGDSVIFQSP
jgi:hypothetical protein